MRLFLAEQIIMVWAARTISKKGGQQHIFVCGSREDKSNSQSENNLH